MKDYYYLLGVSRQAQLEDIKKAYRRLASKFHPDTNQGDTWFTERFKELQEAYEILSDVSSRANYDMQLHASVGSSYQRYTSDEEETQRREEQINFKEEVLRRKQEELAIKEAELKRELEEVHLWYSKWYNRFNFTRKLYEQWLYVESFWQQVQNSLPFSLPTISFPPQLKQFISLKKGVVMVGICIFSLALFGFLKYKNHPEPVEETVGLEELAVANKTYKGTIGEFGAVFTLEWTQNDSLVGSYFYTKNESEVFILKGVNKHEGEIRLKGYLDQKHLTQLKLNKAVSDSTICWEGKMLNRGGIMMEVNMCRDRNVQIFSDWEN